MIQDNAKVPQEVLSSWGRLDGRALLDAVLNFGDKLKTLVTTSFGSESAVLLDLIAQVDTSTPVVFVDTGKLFPETLAYRDRLVDHFGLSDVRTVRAPEALVASSDPDGTLFETNHDECCHVRKVMPYAHEVAEFDVLISGRKRHHGDARAELPTVEQAGRHIKINPLAHYSADDIEAAFKERDLPRHPLAEAGYGSIGCAPCTNKSCPTKGARAGRWSGQEKTECGIHTFNTFDSVGLGG